MNIIQWTKCPTAAGLHDFVYLQNENPSLITAINFGLPLKAMRLLFTEKFDPLPNGHIRLIHPTQMPRGPLTSLLGQITTYANYEYLLKSHDIILSTGVNANSHQTEKPIQFFQTPYLTSIQKRLQAGIDASAGCFNHSLFFLLEMKH